MSALILVWLLSSSPSAVLVAGQNLLCMCCSHLGKYGYSWLPQMRRALCLSKVLEASSGANYHGWIHIPSGSHLPAMHPNIENFNGPLPVSFSQQWICAHWHFRIVSMLSYGVWVYRSHCLTHKLLFAKYVKRPLWKGVFNIKFIPIFSVNNLFHLTF